MKTRHNILKEREETMGIIKGKEYSFDITSDFRVDISMAIGMLSMAEVYNDVGNNEEKKERLCDKVEEILRYYREKR